MITELRIRGLGVIDEAVVSLAPGLTVLTGETGAGKTMVLTGLDLLMGGKADAGIVRSGTPRAEVDGEWRLDDSAREALERLEQAGAAVEDEGTDVRVILARTVAAEGRSRAFAGGRSVPATALTEITASLVSVHGQSDQLLLRDARAQRSLLDRYGGSGLAATMAKYRNAFHGWRAVRAELDALVAARQERERSAALLRHGLAEIAAVDPQPGEDDDLKARATVLAHTGELGVDVDDAHRSLAGAGFDASADEAPAARDHVGQARRAVERASMLDPTLGDLLPRLDEAASLLDDVAAELTTYAAALDTDPARQAEVEERRQVIGDLKRRYGPTLADVLAWREASAATVDEVDGDGERVESLTLEAAACEADTVALAAELSALRAAAGQRLSVSVTAELADLAMPDADFTVEVASVADPSAFGSDGADAVQMLLRPHAGAEPRPVGRGASGGELSRVMLAIEVALAGTTSTPTFVFDEVDAGIGGRVAVEVGRRLARLARTAQVVVVTHLPQVAAFADRHLVVTKGSDGLVTAASVVEVEDEARVVELVRMLSGLDASEAGAAHAEELLTLAGTERAR